MLNKNEIYPAEITSYGSEGEGVCRINNIAVFVPFSVKGDKINVKILKTAKTYAYGKIENIIEPSEDRIEPECEVYGKCGGCNIMHMSYDAELEYKRQKVEDSIRHIAKLKTEVLPVIKADKLNNYRNKVQIPVGLDKDGNAAAGFYSLRSHNIIPNCNCIIQNKTSLPILEAVVKWMNDFNIPPYNENNNTGSVRHIYIRIAEATGEIMVAIVINTRRVQYTNELVEALIPLGVKTVICNINREKTNVVLGDKNLILYGDGRITDELCGLKFSISTHSFFQVNHDQTEKLYKTAMDAANIKKEDTVFDIYCGIGTISLYAAKFAKKVIGIEIVPEAVEDAKNNAKLNEINNAEFYCGDAGEVAQELISNGEKADVVIIDPPRKGCDIKLINQILNINPKRVVYISCNPSTLARDLKYFNEQGYLVGSVQPVDMFVYSSHVETVVLMSRIDK